MPTFWCCCGCDIHFVVKKCFGVAAVGAVVTLYTGYVTVGNCTTDATGKCKITVPSSGTYRYTIHYSDLYQTVDVTATLNCNETVTVNLVPVSGHCGAWCCGHESPPSNVYWTDALGTVTMPVVYDSITNFYDIPAVCVNRTLHTCSSVFIPAGTCNPFQSPYNALVPIVGQVAITYKFECPNNMHITWFMCFGSTDCAGDIMPGTSGMPANTAVAFMRNLCGAATDSCGFQAVNHDPLNGSGCIVQDVALTGTCANDLMSLSGTMAANIVQALGGYNDVPFTLVNPLGTSGVLTR